MPVTVSCTVRLPLGQLDGIHLEESVFQAGLTLVRQPLSASHAIRRSRGNPFSRSWPSC